MEEQYPGLSPAGVAYQKIRRVCADQEIFDDLWFMTLEDQGGTLAVFGSIEGEDTTMSLWRRARNRAVLKDTADDRLQLTIAIDDELGTAHPVDPAAQNFGLVLPDSSDTEFLAEGCSVLLDLLESAEPADHDLPAETREVYIETLNEVLGEFLDDEEDEDDDYYPNEMDLQRYAAQSGFTSIRFGFMPVSDEHEAFFTAVTLTTHAGEKHFFAWDEPGSDGENRFVLKVDGAEYRTITPIPVMPSLPSVVGFSPEELDRAVKDIHTIHLFGRAAHIGRTEEYIGDLAEALSMAMDHALAGNDPVPLDFFLHDHPDAGQGEHDEGHLLGEAWHDLLQEFTRLCRLGLFGGVVVEESAVGPSLTVRARTFDPVAHQKVELQTFWKHGEDGEGEHWLAADQATCPAHDVDPMYPELLAGFALDSRNHIRHAITHLHDLSDLASLIIEAKVNEMDELFEILDAKNPDADVPDAVLGQMRADAIEDALAAMNGIAAIYTGPSDPHIRDS